MQIDNEGFRRALLDYYSQRGGSHFPVFQGAENQYGSGLGDIFRAIGRFVLPIFTSGASRFISSTASGLSEGRTLKDSAKDALAPTLGEAMNATSSQVMSRFGGRGRRRRKGRGKRRARPKTKKTKSMRRKSRKIAAPAFGVYKGAGRKRKNSSKRRKSRKSRKVRFFPSNF